MAPLKKNSLPKHLILKKRDEIVDVLKNGRRFEKGSVRLLILKQAGPGIKLAFLVSKRLGRKAVLRNKVKRWFREIFRKSKDYFSVPAHIVMTSAANYEDLNYDILNKDFLEVVRSEEFTDYINQVLSETNISAKKE